MMSEEIRALHEKIDFLTQQVVSVTSRLKAFDEFKEDLTLFANDAFNETVNFLADVDFHFRSKEFVVLIKQLLRNVRNLSKMMTQLQSITELAEDLSPLVKEVLNDLVEKFEQVEKEGLLDSLQIFLSGLRRLHRNFSLEDIERMGENHVRLIKISNRLTTSKNLEKLEHIADEIEKMDFKKTEKVSFWKLLKKAGKPEVLRSISLALDIAAIISRPNHKAEVKIFNHDRK